jgi:hypothetical protein
MKVKVYQVLEAPFVNDLIGHNQTLGFLAILILWGLNCWAICTISDINF